MPDMEIFIAAAIAGASALGLMVYLHKESKTEFWKGVWLSGAFLIVSYLFSVVYVGFQTVLVITSLADLTFSVLHAVLWIGGFLLLAYTFWNLLKIMIKSLTDTIREKRKE